MTSPDDVQALIESPAMKKAWLAYETAEPIPLDEGNAAYDKRVRMLKHAFVAGFKARDTAALGEIGELREGLLIYRRVTSVDLLEPDELAKIDALLEQPGG